mgnify:FL=1
MCAHTWQEMIEQARDRDTEASNEKADEYEETKEKIDEVVSTMEESYAEGPAAVISAITSDDPLEGVVLVMESGTFQLDLGLV